MCTSIHKGGGGDLSLKMVENVMGLGHPDKVDQYCSLVNSKRGSVPGLKFHHFALCTIDTHTSNVSLALFCLTHFLYIPYSFVFEIRFKCYSFVQEKN